MCCHSLCIEYICLVGVQCEPVPHAEESNRAMQILRVTPAGLPEACQWPCADLRQPSLRRAGNEAPISVQRHDLTGGGVGGAGDKMNPFTCPVVHTCLFKTCLHPLENQKARAPPPLTGLL